MPLIVAVDVPQKVLDVFNKIDYTNTNTLKKIGLRAFVATWSNQNLPKKTATGKYISTGAKKIVKDFDNDLLEIINVVDWKAVSAEKMKYMLDFMTQNAKNFVTMR